MSRTLLVLRTDDDRRRAAEWANKVPAGTRTIWQAPRRTLDQNAKLWVLLGEVSRKTKWHSVKLMPNDWKLLFLSGLKREVRVVPNLTGDGFVDLGRSSSDLSVSEMSDLIELIYHFCAERNISLDEAHEIMAFAPKIAEDA